MVTYRNQLKVAPLKKLFFLAVLNLDAKDPLVTTNKLGKRKKAGKNLPTI